MAADLFHATIHAQRRGLVQIHARRDAFVKDYESLDGVSGKYFSNCNVDRPRRDGTDEATAKRLWTVTEEIVAKLPRS